jgi:hypothetical protein
MFIYCMVLFVFPALLALDMKRIRSGRGDCFCKPTTLRDDPEAALDSAADGPNKVQHGFWRTKFLPLYIQGLVHPAGKALVLSVFVVIMAWPVNRGYNALVDGFNPRVLFRPNEAEYRFFTHLDSFSFSALDLYTMGGIDWPNKQAEFLNLAKTIEYTDHILPEAEKNWMRMFIQWGIPEDSGNPRCLDSDVGTGGNCGNRLYHDLTDPETSLPLIDVDCTTFTASEIYCSDSRAVCNFDEDEDCELCFPDYATDDDDDTIDRYFYHPSVFYDCLNIWYIGKEKACEDCIGVEADSFASSSDAGFRTEIVDDTTRHSGEQEVIVVVVNDSDDSTDPWSGGTIPLTRLPLIADFLEEADDYALLIKQTRCALVGYAGTADAGASYSVDSDWSWGNSGACHDWSWSAITGCHSIGDGITRPVVYLKGAYSDCPSSVASGKIYDDDVPAFVAGTAVQYFEQYITLRDDLYHNIGYGLIVAFCLMCGIYLAVQPPSSGNLSSKKRVFDAFWTALLVTMAIWATVFAISGALGDLGLDLNAFPAVSLIICVGLSIESTAHLALAFVCAAGDRNMRMVSALNHMFLPTTAGSISTFVGVLPLAFSPFNLAQQIYFPIFAVQVGMCTFVGLMVLPVVLSMIGPVTPSPLNCDTTSSLANTKATPTPSSTLDGDKTNEAAVEAHELQVVDDVVAVAL